MEVTSKNIECYNKCSCVFFCLLNLLKIWPFTYRAIGISDYKILREALADPAFAGRPSLNVFQARSKDVIARGELKKSQLKYQWHAFFVSCVKILILHSVFKGLLFTEGRQWAEQRRFAIRQLKDLGYAKSSLETLIQSEIVDFVNELKKECDHPISLRAKFNASIVSTVWSLVVGKREDNAEITAIFKMCTK